MKSHEDVGWVERSDTQQFQALNSFLVAELDKRITEDDAFPQDVVAWEVVKAESLARWKRK